MRLFVSFIFCAFLSGAYAEPKFFAPDESYPLIKRDLIPIDPDGINTLAEQLATLADGPLSKSGRDLHNRARILALSLRLSPAQPRARAILQSLGKGENRPNTDKRMFKEAWDGTQRTAEWLVKLSPDEEGFLLGQLLLDIISVRQKDHPLLSSHTSGDQDARWAGLITPLEKFENKEKEPPKPTGPEIEYKTEAVLTTTPMITYPASKKDAPRGIMQQVTLVISNGSGDGDGPRVVFRPRPRYDARPTIDAAAKYFESKGQPFPRNKTFTIDIGTPYSSENGTNIAAPVASLVDAAMTGRTLRRNAYLFAKLENDGSLSRPTKAWPILLELADHAPPKGSRLIVPPGIADDLRSLLVMEKADFFVQYEVIGVTHFDEARPLFYEDGQPDAKLVAAMESYQEIWDKALEATSVQTFVSHQSVKERLSTVVGHSKLHVSASYLALQGNNRPPYFSEKMLAREILRCLEPISNFRYDLRTTKAADFRKLHNHIEERLEFIERKIDRKHYPLYQDSLDLNKKLNGIARNFHKDGRDFLAFNNFRGELTAFRQRLQITSGDLVPPKPKSN